MHETKGGYTTVLYAKRNDASIDAALRACLEAQARDNDSAHRRLPEKAMQKLLGGKSDRARDRAMAPHDGSAAPRARTPTAADHHRAARKTIKRNMASRRK